ncbi:uncharacterized protein TRAVEDRAFT_21099 [Trametes versicolor FP-101664 SS1]|uniref:uncharacterized protein n=1 Tax=Trametes versicolor (strain FP-101664) TaxID=717944 RepID=UPI0004624662|nr:uncharacterized protein TRAVEDRAFT_21099 [Trametes versicolor FP-101664 SS1]EIW57506.1 hypothetical protein TRAVEDRAFT_21099 [Trametes versicolor FP-101664 SS1]
MPVASSNEYPPTYAVTDEADRNKQNDVRVDVRNLTRTPSPTPSEAEALSPGKKKKGGFIRSLFNPETYKDRKEFIRLVITGAIIALVVLFVVYQQNIVNWMRPFADWMRRTPGGWLIPIAIMIILSFPPLFGHEIIAILCGDVWGIWIGFAIVAAGTIIGELINYFVFRYFCTARSRGWEEKKLRYGLLAEVVRQGGFVMAVVLRYSAIPGHLTTTVFATCGMSVFTFLGAAVLSLPTQLATVYLGSAQSNGTVDSRTKTIKTVVIVVTIATTIFAMRYVRIQTEKITPEVVYRRRKARQAKALAAAGMQTDSETALVYDDSDNLPLRGGPSQTVKLDGVTLHVPTPQVASSSRGYAPELAPGQWNPNAFTVPQAPQRGYSREHARSPSRSAVPTSSPYGVGSPGEPYDAYGHRR